MSSKDKAQTPLLPSSSTTSRSGSNARRTSNTKKSTNSSSSSSSSLLLSSSHTKQQTSQSMSSSTTSARAKKGKDTDRAKLSSASSESRKSATTKPIKDETIVIEPRNRQLGAKATTQFQNRNALGQKLSQKKPGPSLSSSSSLSLRSTRGMNEESSSSSQEMTITSPNSDHGSVVARQERSTERSLTLEQETDIDRSFENQATDDDESATLLESSSGGNSMLNNKRPALISCASSEHSLIEGQQRARHHHLPDGWEEHTDKEGVYYWHVPTGVIQRTKPTEDVINQIQIRDEQLVLYHDDEEINQTSAAAVRPSRTSSEEDDYTLESGAALTLADESTLSDAISFVVYPLGCCEFDETQLISANSTRAIQKCILRLSNLTNNEDEQCTCWGLDQTQPILMRLLDDHIQFIDISTQTLLRSQPIQTIKTWAVDDDNNFAFVVEDNSEVSSTTFTGESGQLDSVDYALLTGPNFMCYVFSSMDDDDMSLKVATKLNKEINRYRMQMSNRISKCTRLQQMVNSKPLSARLVASNKKHQPPVVVGADNDQTDADEDLEDENGGGGDDEDDDLAESSEMSLNVRYIGKVQVPRPMGIDVLNVAIDKCLADASKAQMDRLLDRNVASTSTSTSAAQLATSFDGQLLEISSPLTEAKLHVSPSSVIVENEQTGEIIVECRIRYLTFMGISRRDIRWCGFIMQNTTNQTFVAHCFECHPTAGHVCEAIQTSCSRMYEKMVKRQKMKQQVDDVTSIMPKSSKIRDTLAKTLSKIKLTPIL